MPPPPPHHPLRVQPGEPIPTGFEWGYGGSGPAQLALALAADVLGEDEAALDVYQRLKFRVVGRLPADGWTLTEAELADALRGLARPDSE